MGVSIYAVALDNPREFIRCGKTAGREGSEAALLAFIEDRQNVVIFREDSVPVKEWAKNGFFDTLSMPEADPLKDRDPILVKDLADGMERSARVARGIKGEPK